MSGPFHDEHVFVGLWCGEDLRLAGVRVARAAALPTLVADIVAR